MVIRDVVGRAGARRIGGARARPNQIAGYSAPVRSRAKHQAQASLRSLPTSTTSTRCPSATRSSASAHLSTPLHPFPLSPSASCPGNHHRHAVDDEVCRLNGAARYASNSLSPAPSPAAPSRRGNQPPTQTTPMLTCTTSCSQAFHRHHSLPRRLRSLDLEFVQEQRHPDAEARSGRRRPWRPTAHEEGTP